MFTYSWITHSHTYNMAELSMHRLNLTLDSHLCYPLDNFPVISNAGSVRLLAPLPLTGTIMTGLSSASDQFNLYLDKTILKFELISSHGFVKLSMDQALNCSTSYQVDFQIRADMVELNLATISGSIIKRLIKTVTFPVASFFTTVCVGGTMLEIPYYVGILERVIYNAVPLSDHSFVQQYARVETPVNLISISDQFAGPPLIFEQFNFANYRRITFEMRLNQDTTGLSGTPFASSGKFEIQFTTFIGQFAIFGGNRLMVLCPNTPLVDNNEWHRIDLTLTTKDNGTADFTLTIDDKSCDRLTDLQRVQFGELLASLTDSNAPLRFGVSKLAQDTVTVLVKFIGCFRNIEFRETPNSEPIRPDLASVIRSGKRFSKGEEECYACSQQDKLTRNC